MDEERRTAPSTEGWVAGPIYESADAWSARRMVDDYGNEIGPGWPEIRLTSGVVNARTVGGAADNVEIRQGGSDHG